MRRGRGFYGGQVRRCGSCSFVFFRDSLAKSLEVLAKLWVVFLFSESQDPGFEFLPIDKGLLSETVVEHAEVYEFLFDEKSDLLEEGCDFEWVFARFYA